MAKLAMDLVLDYGLAVVLDWLIGDPYWLYHPVRIIGHLIHTTETLLRRLQGRIHFHQYSQAFQVVWERFFGIILAVLTVGITCTGIGFILKIGADIHPILFHILNIYLLYSALATRCLADEALKVHTLLVQKNLPKACERVGMLVGRETAHSNEKEVIRAVVETTAENTVDGVISPLFYIVVGSCFGIAAPLAFAFKAISTLDSMVGYKNARYLHWGWASAKLDDLANYLPARLSGLLIPFSFLLMGKGFRNSFTMMRRDSRNHTSPNCAFPEAAVAGGLSVQLGGNNIYFGKLVHKPTIGDPTRDLVNQDILQTVHMLYYASATTSIIGFLVISIASLK
jgi:adenosylcobinamide-phosphate synthase